MTKPLEFPVPESIRLVQVQWEDIGGEAGWADTDFIRRWATGSAPYSCVSVGYKVYMDNEKLILAASFSADGWGDLQYYPRSIIYKIETIKVVQKRAVL